MGIKNGGDPLRMSSRIPASSTQKGQQMNQDLQAQQPPAADPTPQKLPLHGLALTGFILAFVFAPVGLILSIVAKKQINASGGTLGGGGLATGGIIVGIIFCVILVLNIAVIAANA
jgi:hypothetical protein